MKVSLVATVKDAGPAVHGFLEGLRRQTRRPDEVVVVDGGSTDGTLEALRAAPDVVVISEPGANISRGRNAAIAAAAHDVIAVTDADCAPEPGWLECLLVPIEGGAAVSAGFYRPVTGPRWQRYAVSHVPDAAEVGPGWMPSSRSIAFTRRAYEAAGGYPEWLEVGEDMYFNHRLVEAGFALVPAPEAVVAWPIRPTLAATWRQYRRYAQGDAEAGMYPWRHLARFAAYGGAAAALSARRPALTALVLAAAVAHVRTPVRRTWRRLPPDPRERAAAAAGVPLLLAFMDLAKMWGYLRGLAGRIRR